MRRSIRAHLAEFGIVAPVGRKGVEKLLGVVADSSDQRLPTYYSLAGVFDEGILSILRAKIIMSALGATRTWRRSLSNVRFRGRAEVIGRAVPVQSGVHDPKATTATCLRSGTV